MYNLFAFAIGARLVAFIVFVVAFMRGIFYLPNWNNDKASSYGRLVLCSSTRFFFSLLPM